MTVGGPASTDASERVLRVASCTIGDPHDLLEWRWAWYGFPANDCADIRPGSSGSPIIDAASGVVVGLIDTTTQGAHQVSACVMGNPCEVAAAGVRSLPDTSYGPTLDVLEGCFDTSWTFSGPGEDCGLDPGDGLAAVTWTLSANPGATPISGGPASPATWQLALTGPPMGLTRLRTATGRPGELDCHGLAAYGEVQPYPADGLFDPPLPTEDGSHLLCLIGVARDEPAAWAAAVRFPMVARVDIDRTPPLGSIGLSVVEDVDGWSVEPVFRPPELSLFDWKWGPAEATDCDDPAGYQPYRRFPTTLPFAEAPTRLCVIGYDDATNRTPALDRVFEAP